MLRRTFRTTPTRFTVRTNKRTPRVPVSRFRNALVTRRWQSQDALKELKVTIATPNAMFLDSAVADSVVVPGLEGQFEVLPRLAPLITELQPGVVTVLTKGNRAKYFVSGGFVFVHPDSTCSVNPTECVKMEDLDPELTRNALAQAQSKLGQAKTPQERAMAQIAVDTADAVLKALMAK